MATNAIPGLPAPDDGDRLVRRMEAIDDRLGRAEAHTAAAFVVPAAFHAGASQIDVNVTAGTVYDAETTVTVPAGASSALAFFVSRGRSDDTLGTQEWTFSVSAQVLRDAVSYGTAQTASGIIHSTQDRENVTVARSDLIDVSATAVLTFRTRMTIATVLAPPAFYSGEQYVDGTVLFLRA